MESDSIQRKALPIEIDESTFDPNKEPQNGHEFLMQVIHERKYYPEVVVKPLKTGTETEELQCSENNEFNDISPEHLKPNKIWKQMQLETFENVRLKVNSFRNEISHKDNTIGLPETCAYDQWKTFCRENEPLMHIIINIPQRTFEALLEYQSDWLNCEDDTVDFCENGNYWWLGKWIYSTLVCLKLPLDPNVHSNMRNIVKSCVYLRNKLDYDSVDAAIPYNLIIFLIAKFYRQLDLLQYV